jgi:hypothetical protein
MVGGWPGSPVYAKRYRSWMMRLRSHLTDVGDVPAANIPIISGDDEFVEEAHVEGTATGDTVAALLTKMQAVVREEDQFILVICGHGTITSDPPSLVLRGPDFDAKTLASLLKSIKARNQVVLNFSASAGAFVRFIAARHRVNVAANSASEGVEPVFGEFFLRALEEKRADGWKAPEAGRRDGKVTVLEAYNWATWQAAQWIARQNHLGGRMWRISGAKSGEVFRTLCSGPEDAMGSRTVRVSGSSDEPDPVMPLRPPGGQYTEEWRTRRIITEHASLEDCGEEVPVSALTPAAMAMAIGGGQGEEPPDFVPLAGTRAGQPGARARRVLLGRPALLQE